MQCLYTVAPTQCHVVAIVCPLALHRRMDQGMHLRHEYPVLLGLDHEYPVLLGLDSLLQGSSFI